MSEEFQFGPLQTAWLEALESGKYEQGKEWLKRNDKYCCLGVLCEIAGISYDPESSTFSDGRERQAGVIPLSLAERIGLSENYGRLKEPTPKGQGCLVDMNDLGDYRFPEIAAYIRANPTNVFSKAA